MTMRDPAVVRREAEEVLRHPQYGNAAVVLARDVLAMLDVVERLTVQAQGDTYKCTRHDSCAGITIQQRPGPVYPRHKCSVCNSFNHWKEMPLDEYIKARAAAESAAARGEGKAPGTGGREGRE